MLGAAEGEGSRPEDAAWKLRGERLSLGTPLLMGILNVTHEPPTFFGVVPQIVDGDGKVIEGEGSGNLCIAEPWPGMMRTVFGDHERFVQTYFSTYKGKYFTGDGCRRDEDGYYWITGRVDDVINVSGHRLGTAEIESALVAHEARSGKQLWRMPLSHGYDEHAAWPLYQEPHLMICSPFRSGSQWFAIRGGMPSSRTR